MTVDPLAAWQVDSSDYPAAGTDADKLRFLVRYAVLAPSSHNTQPWKFRVENQHLDVLADRSRALPVADPADRELIISCGAAVGVLQVALWYFGHTGRIELLPDGDRDDVLARISLGGRHEPTQLDRARFDAIRRRRSTRQKFEDEPIPADLQETLSRVATGYGVEFAAVTDDATRTAIAEVIAEADEEQFDDAEFRRELTDWINSKRRSHDGMSLASYGAPDLASAPAALVMRTFDVGGGLAAQDKQIATGAPALVIVATDRDEPRDWLTTGIAHVVMLLDATSAGLTADYLNQPIE